MRDSLVQPIHSGDPSNRHRLSPRAAKWDTLATYESKAECERGHRERFSRVKATEQSDSAEADSIAKEGAELNQQKPLDSEKANALLVRSIAAMVKIQSNQKVILSECIATDDPRLKEK
jgi:hypothetical protein